jgi:hypothetical protein
MSISCTSYLVVYLALKLEEPKPISKCMYGISHVEFTKVEEIHVFLVDSLKWLNAKVLCMETQKKPSYPISS